MNKTLITIISLTFFTFGCSERENPLLELKTLDEMSSIYKRDCDPKREVKDLQKCEEYAKTTEYSVKELSDPIFNKKYNNLFSIRLSCIKSISLALRYDKAHAQLKSRPECKSFINSKAYQKVFPNRPISISFEGEL